MIKYLFPKYEDMKPYKKLGGCCSTLLQSQYWGSGKTILGCYWPASLAFLASPKPVSGPVSAKGKVDYVDTVMHTHTCMHTHKHIKVRDENL